MGKSAPLLLAPDGRSLKEASRIGENSDGGNFLPESGAFREQPSADEYRRDSQPGGVLAGSQTVSPELKLPVLETERKMEARKGWSAER